MVSQYAVNAQDELSARLVASILDGWKHFVNDVIPSWTELLNIFVAFASSPNLSISHRTVQATICLAEFANPRASPQLNEITKGACFHLACGILPQTVYPSQPMSIGSDDSDQFEDFRRDARNAFRAIFRRCGADMLLTEITKNLATELQRNVRTPVADRNHYAAWSSFESILHALSSFAKGDLDDASLSRFAAVFQIILQSQLFAPIKNETGTVTQRPNAHRRLACQWCILGGVFAKPLAQKGWQYILSLADSILGCLLFNELDDYFQFRTKEDHAAAVSLVKVVDVLTPHQKCQMWPSLCSVYNTFLLRKTSPPTGEEEITSNPTFALMTQAVCTCSAHIPQAPESVREYASLIVNNLVMMIHIIVINNKYNKGSHT